MSVTIIIPALVALAVALIAAGVAIYGKRLDRIHAIDARYAAAREFGYDLILAAGDLAWNFIARNYVSEADTGRSLPTDEREVEIGRCSALLTQGLDQLEAHAVDMDKVRPVLSIHYKVIFENTDGSAADYETVRRALVECRRREVGLQELIRNKPGHGWRQLLPTKAIRRWRTTRRELESDKPTYRGIEVDELISTTDGVTIIGTGDGDTFAALLEEQRMWASQMRASVATTEARLRVWREKDVLKYS